MALLLFSTPTTTLTALASSSQLTSAIPANRFSRLQKKSIGLQSEHFNGLHIHTSVVHKQRGAVTVKASADIYGTGPDVPLSPSKSDEENLSLENLPLESKLQLKLEQKMKMKLAKKIRLRRKKLVRKRHLRKKGRWPPSKMKKNKNV